MSFLTLVLRNLAVRRLRTTMTALVVAIGVLTVITLGIVLSSIRSSALAVLQTGRADFTVSQRGVSDVLNSNIDSNDVTAIRTTPGVADAAGALIGTIRLNRANPLFLQIGLRPQDFSAFGVTIVDGHGYAEGSPSDVLLGRGPLGTSACRVGDSFVVDGQPRHVVGIFSTGQALGDAGMMLPLDDLPGRAAPAGRGDAGVRPRPAWCRRPGVARPRRARRTRSSSRFGRRATSGAPTGASS